MSQANENVAEEIQQEEIVQPQESQDTSPEVSSQEEKVSYSKDENFTRLRESKEQLERKNDRIERENDELRAEKAFHAKKQEPPSEDDSLGIEDDDLAEGKHLNKLDKKIKDLDKAQKDFQKTIAEEKLALVPAQLRAKFDDFDEVVSEENIEKLKKLEPEMYRSLREPGDVYTKGVTAYKTLLAMGIVKKDNYKSQKEDVHNNHKKPVSTQAIRGQGPLSEANQFQKGLTPELKKQYQEEMAEAVKAR